MQWLAEASHELVGVVVGWSAERDAHAQTVHLAEQVDGWASNGDEPAASREDAG